MPIIKRYNDYFHLNTCLYTKSDDYIKLSQEIFKRLSLKNVYKIDQKQQMLLSLLLNLRIGYEAGQHVAYSRRKNYYSTKDCEYFTYNNLIPIVDSLKYLGLLNERNGYLFSEKQAPARLNPTLTLETELKKLSLGEILEEVPRDTIILRNSEKESVPFEWKPALVLMKDNLELINKVRSEAKIGLANVPHDLVESDRSTLGRFILNPIEYESGICKYLGIRIGYLHRVFNLNFRRGGRFYGGFETAISRELRPYITINCQPTVEIDFKALHINMLYHKMKIDYSKDPYLDICSKQDPNERRAMKSLMLIGINAKDKPSAVKAFRSDMNKKGLMKGELTDRNILKKFEMIETQHPLLVKYLYHDKGGSLMNIDSKIAESVLLKFAKDGILCLCIHDSFIVEAKYKDMLEDEMNKAYFKFLKFEPKLEFDLPPIFSTHRRA